MIKYSSPHITQEDIDMVSQTLRGGHIAGRGEIVEAFEEGLCKYTGYRYAISVNSATSGLYLLYLFLREYSPDTLFHDAACNIDRGLVIVPALTFVATMNAPLLAGFEVVVKDVEEWMTVVFDDIESRHYNSPVSYSGKFVDGNHRSVIDHAQCLLPDMGFGDISMGAVISTHAIKNITTGEGGVVLTNRKDVASFVRSMADHGVGGTNYGHNFRMSSIQAALGLSQLTRATDSTLFRRWVHNYYSSHLIGVETIEGESSHHTFPVILKDQNVNRDEFRELLEASGIGTQIHHTPLYYLAQNHRLIDKIHFNEPHLYPNTERMWTRGFSLPMHNALNTDDVEYIVDTFNHICENLL